MELYEEILTSQILRGNLQLSCADGPIQPAELVESVCYQALKRIKEIVEDDSLNDCECFMKIEEIVCTLESLGSGGGTRHDFG